MRDKMKKAVFFVCCILLLGACGQENSSKDSSENTTESTSESTTKSTERKKYLSVTNPVYSTDNSTFSVTGKAKPDTEVKILSGSDEIGSVQSNQDGTFAYESTIPETENITYKVTNEDESKTFSVKSKQTILDEKAEEERKQQEAAAAAEAAAQKKAEEERIAAEQKAAEDEAKRVADEKAALIANATREQKNALQTAKDYLNYTSFSKSGLYDQLIYEQYPADAAQFAIDNIEVDWNAQALQTAKDYLDYSSFSDQGLYDQLIYEGFEPGQAQYAIDNLPQ